MRKGRISGLLGFIVLISIVISFSTAQAAPYYQGKTIRMIVGNTPGGGYDRMARLFAKYLPKYLPGKPVIIVENMPGGATIVAANYIYNLTKPDGTVIGALGRGLPIAQLLKAEGIKFDMTKFGWIGSTAVEATVLTVRTDLPYNNVNDLRKASSPVMIGTTGPAESSHQFATLLKEFAGLNLKMISYPSGNEINLAIERKEVDGRASSYSGIKPFVERGLVRPLIRSKVSEKGIEKLPVDEDLVSDQTGKTIMALRSSPEKMGRPFITTPKTPPSVLNMLRKAFADVAADKDAQAEAKKLMMEIEYVSGDECLKITKYMIEQPENIVKEVDKYIKF